jgi:flavin-binding protein dodecin
MCPTDEAAHLVTGHSGNLEGFHTFSRTFEADNGKVTDYRINAKVSFDLETEG